MLLLVYANKSQNKIQVKLETSGADAIKKFTPSLGIPYLDRS